MISPATVEYFSSGAESEPLPAWSRLKHPPWSLGDGNYMMAQGPRGGGQQFLVSFPVKKRAMSKSQGASSSGKQAGRPTTWGDQRLGEGPTTTPPAVRPLGAQAPRGVLRAFTCHKGGACARGRGIEAAGGMRAFEGWCLFPPVPPTCPMCRRRVRGLVRPLGNILDVHLPNAQTEFDSELGLS